MDPNTPPESLRLALLPSEKPGRVRLTCAANPGDPANPCEAPFDFTTFGQHNEQLLQKIEAGTCTEDELKEIGSQLWAALLNGDVERKFEEVRKARNGAPLILRLNIPPHLDTLPWEALHDEKTRTGFLALSRDVSIVREAPLYGSSRIGALQGDELRMVAVIPTGSNLNVESEWQSLNGITRPGLKISRLPDVDITPAILRDALRESPYEIVHYIGHGSNVEGKFSIRFNAEGAPQSSQYIEGDRFALLFEDARERPSLVLLNCCHGAGGDGRKSLSGVGGLLMRAGVSAVIAMHYEISDKDATRFAGAFYKELFGAAKGRVDLAIGWARRTLYAEQSVVRGFITPVLYVVEGQEKLFAVEDAPPKAAPVRVPSAPARTQDPRLEKIIRGIKDGRAVPIVGPGVLKLGAMRSGTPGAGPEAIAPGPGELARYLSTESAYPFADEVALAAARGRFGESVLPWVCQHYQKTRGPFQLISAVRDLLSKAAPSPTLRAVAAWPHDAMIATYFDGLVDEALAFCHKSPRAMNLRSTDFRFDPGESILLRVRGTHQAPDSLVLTQQDQERLYDSLGKLSGDITTLFRRHIGRFPIFIGVSPRDILTLRLLSQLISANDSYQESGYFIGEEHSPGDEAWWEQCKVEWIDAGLEEILAQINAAVLPGVPV